MSLSRTFFTALAGIFLSLPAVAQEDKSKPTPDKSMLRVNVTSQGWNFALPWQRMNPGTRRGLGALLPGNRVLVTAELAQDAKYVEMEIASSGRKLVGKVEAVDYELNLATIIPAAEPGDFFNGFIPLEPDPKLKPRKEIEVWQFENNGAPVTSSLDLQRADVAGYFLEDSVFLIFQANGAVQYRAGTFTLPVVHEGKLAGMLIRYNSRDQVADIIPPQIIARFLDDVATAPYEGVPNFGAKTGHTLDPQLRRFLKLDGMEGGILVTGTTPGFSAELAGIKERDVIMEINGHKLDSRGYYNDPELGLLASIHLLRGAARTGDVAKLKVIRDGQPLDLDCKLQRRQPTDYLVDPYMFDRGPRYVIMGGLLFQELTLNYLQMAGREWRDRAPFRLLFAQQNQEDLMKEGRRKLVFLSGVLPAPCTTGYERLRQLIVTKVNDKPINDIKDLAEALKSPIEGIHKIEFNDHPGLIHVDAAQAEQDNKEFLPARYRITRLERLE
jgi:hypothetical protein